MDTDAMAKALGFTGQVAADQACNDADLKQAQQHHDELQTSLDRTENLEASNEEGMAVALPSEAELQDPSSDPQEMMPRLCAWVEAGRRSGHLEMEAKAL